jgi:glycosyltransferase involved in cell wall biosynthesis
MKLVTTVHGWGVRTGRAPVYYQLDKWSLRHYDAVVCVSEDLYIECLRCGVAATRCHLIHNAIDTEEYRRGKKRDEAKRELGTPPQGVLIGAVGRLSPEKGFDLLIRAVAELLGQGHDVSLWVAGEGDERERLAGLVGQLGLQEHVRLLGHVDNPKAFYEALDAFVLSSIREGLPNVLLEAMALEVPVVATRIAGVPQLIRDGENGLLVDAGSVEPLAVGIRRLLDAPQLAGQLATAARRTIEQSYSFERRMEKMVRVYEDVLGRA